MVTNSIWNKENITVSLVALICLSVYSVFPVEDDIFQGIISGVFFLLVIPLLCIKIILKESLSNYGLQWGNWKKGVILSAFSGLLSAAVVYLLYSYAPLVSQYQIPRFIADNFSLFVFYELVVSGSLIILYEFFFRGFILFSFRRQWGWGAVVLQALAAVVFFGITGNLDWNALPFLLSAVFSGWLAYSTKSLVYSVGFGWLSQIILDAFIISFQK